LSKFDLVIFHYFYGHVTVLSNINWHLQCCQLKNWILKRLILINAH